MNWPVMSGRIFLCRQATDMRKGFDGLSGLVRELFGREPTDGSLFVFVSRRRDMVKVLYWDRNGFALWAKRLERGRFIFKALPGLVWGNSLVSVYYAA